MNFGACRAIEGLRKVAAQKSSSLLICLLVNVQYNYIASISRISLMHAPIYKLVIYINIDALLQEIALT